MAPGVRWCGSSSSEWPDKQRTRLLKHPWPSINSLYTAWTLVAAVYAPGGMPAESVLPSPATSSHRVSGTPAIAK